ncbi:MAG: DUF4231 domain-containing protein [Desulfosarcinaceae bacterium]|nr:DUF4231 domain-containing protein [Desulfosarcinaceae bacterium]
MNDTEYIEARLDHQIKWYDDKSVWNQKWAKWLQAAQIVFAAIIPVLVTYVSDTTHWPRIAVALLGAAIAVITGLLGLYRFKENWIEYRTTCESLRHEKYRYLTKTEPYGAEDALPTLVGRVEALISKENTNWAHLMQQTDSEKPHPSDPRHSDA